MANRLVALGLQPLRIGEAVQQGFAQNRLLRNQEAQLTQQNNARLQQLEGRYFGALADSLSQAGSPEEAQALYEQGLQVGANDLGLDISGAPEQITPEAILGMRNKAMAFGYQPREQKDTRTSSQKDFDRAQSDPEFAAHLNKEGAGDNFKNEKDLRGEFTKLSQDFTKQNAAFGRIQASANDPSAAGDLALIFNYMKLLDPGSTVREGEFANAQNSGGVDQKVRSVYNQVINGQRLGPKQRADFFDRSKRLFSEADGQQKVREKRYTALSERNRLNPANVVIDFRTADPSAEINLGGEAVEATREINGKRFVKINGQWFEE